MFSITCRTCAARLKVKNDAAIGQRLACPKCGEMVEVTAPPGWVPPQESAQALSAGSDFDDIDQIIGGGAGEQRAPGAKIRNVAPSAGSAGTKSPSPTRPDAAKAAAAGKPSPVGSPAQPTPSPAGKKAAPEAPVNPAGGNSSEDFPFPQITPLAPVDKPLIKPRSDKFELDQPREYLPNPNLPPPDWTKTGNTRSRTLLVGGLLLVGLLVVIGAIIALLNQSKEQPDSTQIAQATPKADQAVAAPGDRQPSGETAGNNAPENSDPATATETPAETLADSAAKDLANPDSPGTVPAAQANSESAASSGDASQTGSGAANETAGSSEAQTGNSATPVKTAPDMAADTPSSLPGSNERPVSPLIDDQGPLGNPPATAAANANPAAPGEAVSPTSLTDRLGKLSQLLAGPGTSLTELGDLAQSERTDRLVGLPRYLITQPTPAAPANDPWALPIAEIDYQDVPLHLLVSELSALSGVPLCLDSLALARAGIAVDAPVSVQLTDTTMDEVLAAVLKQLQLERGTVEGVELIQPAGAQVTGTYRLPLPELNEPTPEKYQRLAENLPKLIDQVSWTLDTANRKAVAEATELVVNNTSTAAAQVGEFLEKLTAAQRIRKDRTDQAASAKLRSRAARAEAGLKTPLKLQPTLDQPLEQFLHRVYRESGIAITVDWSALAAAGWSQQSLVPGDFQAETIEQLLRELARSLNATWLEIDEQTFQLTSFQEAARRQLVEVHSLEGLAIGPEPLLEILTQTLGRQLRENPQVRFVYEPEANALVIVAPQSVQRQFEAIVNRLKQPAPQ